MSCLMRMQLIVYRSTFSRAILAMFLLDFILVLPVKAQKNTDYRIGKAPHQSYQSEIESLNRRVSALENKLKKLQGKVSADEFFLTLKADRHTSILLHTNSHGYELLDGGEGIFLISVEKVKPYLTGYQITIQVGNTSEAKYSDAAFTLEWGPTYEKGESGKQWMKKLQTVKQNATRPLYPGTWTPITFILTPATARDLDYLSLSMSATELSLHRVPNSSD